MKIYLSLVIYLLVQCFGHTQELSGNWSGTIQIQNTQLPLIFNIQKTDSIYKTTMDSPAQGARDVVVHQTIVTDALITFLIKSIGASYQGVIKNDTLISGTFKQAGYELLLDLSKNKKSQKSNRPQEPLPPFPYRNENVTFTNKHGSKLSGTLSFPRKIKNNIPAVILISGSGPQNRDSEIMGHKPFLVISDYLVKKGIAVLRYDDRGVGHSEGNFRTATSKDFADDVTSAFDYLSKRPEIDPNKIGLIGHSEGGMVASMVASKNENIGFLILLAATGLKGKDILRSQSKLILEKTGVDKNDIQKITKINRSHMQ